ncbi:MAG: YciC family protein [Motiliproteus sp.]|nr:YciC family protein [Motiliproteus sp.]
MYNTLREAFYFSRNQFQPLLMIALVYALPAYVIELSVLMQEERPDRIYLALINGLFMCLSVIQFGAAVFYIDRLSRGQAISVSQAISMAISRMGNLLILNLLMGIAILGGLMLMIVPGLFLVYKLLFAEFYLLLEDQDPIKALKASYHSTTGFASELLPPLVVWGSLTVIASMMGSGYIDRESDTAWLALLIHQITMMVLSVYGWALIYRLYQKFIEGAPAT